MVPDEAKFKNTSAGMIQERKDTSEQYVVGRFRDIDVEGTGIREFLSLFPNTFKTKLFRRLHSNELP